MNIRCGSTRLVVLWGDWAFKIARIRPFRFLLRLPTWLFSRKQRKHFFEKYGANFFQAIINDVFAGVVANRKEFEYYQSHRKDYRVMPTMQMFFAGLIIVQTRGDEIGERELQSSNPFRNTPKFCEMTEAKQFCRHPDGRLVLVDYGRDEALRVLRQTA